MRRVNWNKLRQWPICLFLGLILVFASPKAALAQFTSARLSGIVTDPSNAVVAEATVTVVDLGTGYSQIVKTGPAGLSSISPASESRCGNVYETRSRRF